MRRSFLIAVVLAAIIAALALYFVVPGSAGGSEGEPPVTELGPNIPPPLKPKYPRLDAQLNRMVEQLSQTTPQAAAGMAPLYQGDSVAISIRLSDDPSAVVQFLEQGGATVASVDTDQIETYAPVALFASLSQQPGVLRVSIIIPPQPDVTSQGTTVHRSTVWNTGGFTGAGVKVGIIDGGFIGYSGLVGTELPSPAAVRCFTSIGVFTANLSDCEAGDVHGTGVAEAVIDVAPDAGLYIANPRTPSDLKSTVSWMVSQCVQVINHSAGWTWDGPGDGTSPFSNSPLKSVDLAVSGGVIWLNSAGNAAKDNWFGSYSDLDGDGLIEFSGSVEVNAVNLSQGVPFIAQARWDDTWDSAARDFDLYLLDADLNVVADSGTEQSGQSGQDPYEVIIFIPPSPGTYYLAIFHFAGSAPLWLQLNAFFGPDLAISTPATSIGNPAGSANAGMLAVGAANWATPNTIESFSSQGPTTDGRIKPDIIGADRGDSVTYGANGFSGTSQSSPHVAGLAALVLERFPSFTPAQLADYLKDNALPRGTVPNNTWGYGFAQLPSLAPDPPTSVSAVAGNGQATVSWSAPSFDGGSAITKYTVTSNPDSLTAEVDGSTLSGTVTSLTNGISYTFTDANPEGATATVNWGDGTTEAGTVNQANDTVSGSHVYADNGTFIVTVTVTDGAGNAGSDTFTVTVSNAVPLVGAQWSPQVRVQRIFS